MRDFREADAPAYQEVCSYQDFQRFYSEEEGDPETLKKRVAMFIDWTKETPRSKVQLAIELRSGVLVGSCGVRTVSMEDRQGTFGCELGTIFWGKGYAFEASRALIQYGFSDLRLHRIYAETISENLPAISLAKKLGLQTEGEFRENKWFRGRWWHTIVLSILESEWKQ